MRVLYCVGNGFDMGLGLKSGSKEVVRSFVNSSVGALADPMPNTTPWRALDVLVQSMQRDFNTWASFEEAFGAFSCQWEDAANDVVVPADDLFRRSHGYFCSFLRDYLIQAERDVNLDDVKPEQASAAFASNLDSGLTPGAKRRLLEFVSRHQASDSVYSFCTFNYTSLLDRVVELADRAPIEFGPEIPIVSRRYEAPFHIHGKLDDPDALLVGVNDATQIASEKIRDAEATGDYFVKPEANRRLENLVDERFCEAIGSADLICVFGMSIGVTDAYWWRKILDWLVSDPQDHLLVLGKHVGESSRSAGESTGIRRAAVNHFLEVAGATPEEVAVAKGAIMVSIDSTGFTLEELVG